MTPQPPCFLVRLLSFKLARFGKYLMYHDLHPQQLTSYSIYKPSKTATQSGDWNSHHWRMDWDPLSKGHRWENPLMGWQSSADFMQGTHLNFQTKEDAIRFANKQGYEFFVQEPNERRIIPKAYANQFVHSPKKLKQVRTK
jgi:NADH dehydrogenase (ubiquinone) Fe-S protein 4